MLNEYFCYLSFRVSSFALGPSCLSRLATRMKDHLNLRNPLTAVGAHCAHEHHKITKDSVRALAREDILVKEKSERSHQN